ncbi:Proline iminopeptidase [Marinobacterium sp. xm-d-420]|jgi:proline iminopeptidase|uniref:prolyl aminopeptidase n=1 Tax=unclassified Marinobacterium TaxID=2644139 RepID=UPI00156970FD|nr:MULTISPECIES: prolyl aminopeptidase [unclassified Marinobacterium]NRP28109.1 Proline iminopeptidase [Marinobacterium sp. xm-d-420]NRP37340.1 Proline iminopeptidase [Marinobacterium sp. xm-d-579]NRP96030.1 Proline iminopeptidase [Marinobacterium sp. xm-g-59]
MRTLYPEISAYHSEQLDVGKGHSLFLELSGNPNGEPILFVHGGPGGGCSPEHRRFFNPEHYKIILFDQRGCGRSTPHGSLENNTTEHLIADIEKIRTHLGLDKWALFGGSWGSTLSLAYAQSHPERVNALFLRGIFLCRPRDIQWFYQEGASYVFPDHWESFIAPIPADQRNDMVSSYYKVLTSDNELERMAAAKAWSIWEGRCSTLDPNPSLVDHFGDPHVALAMARIEAHYFANNSFMSENQLLNHCDRIKKIPTWIVHGRYDMVCPIEQAHLLAKELPQANFDIVRDAGHSAFEPGITDRLIHATDQYLELTS